MPTYACRTCRTKFFAHDAHGRSCGACRKLMSMVANEGGVERGYRVVPDAGQPFLQIGPKYDGQIVLALVDGRKVLYGEQEITNANVQTYMNDKSVPREEKDEYSRMQGERDSAENLHEKENDVPNKHLCIVDDYLPNTPEQIEKIRSALARVPRQGGRIRMYIVGHHDPESRRMAGLEPMTIAQLVGASPHARFIRRITLVGCHTSGEAVSADQAQERLGLESFASAFHSSLGLAHRVYTEVAAYTSYVRIRPMGQKETRFDPNAGHGRKAAYSKVRFFWNERKEQAREFVYT